VAQKYLDLTGLGKVWAKIKANFVSSLGVSGNNLTWTKNGASNNITIPYATNADTVDNKHASDFALAENTYGTTGNFVNGIYTSNYVARGDLGLVGFDNSPITVELYEAASGGSYPSSPTKTINVADATYGVNFRKGAQITMHTCAAGAKLKIIVKSSGNYIKAVGIYVGAGGNTISFASTVGNITKTGSFNTYGSWHIFSCMHETPSSVTLELNTTNVNYGVIIGGFRTYITNPGSLRFPGVANSADSVTWDNISGKPSISLTTHDHDSVYLKLAGGTMTGAAPISFTRDKIAINFRPDSSSYYSKVQYMTAGNEALVFSNVNAVTSFIFKCGLNLADGSNWNSQFNATDKRPSVQIKNQSLYVNSFIASGTSPSYNLYVDGTAGFTGQVSALVAQGTAPLVVTSTTKVANLNSSFLEGYNAERLLHGAYNKSVVYDVLEIKTSATPQEILIKTKLPFTNGNEMPSIYIRGYAYGNYHPVDIHIVFYIYGGAFCNQSATSYGAWDPQIFLFTYTEDSSTYVGIGLKKSVYYPRLYVDIADIWADSGSRYHSGWTCEFNTSTDTSIIPTTNLKEVNYTALTTSITGSAGNVAWANVTGKPTTLSGYGITDVEEITTTWINSNCV